MKKYRVHFVLLILAAGLIILGACGSGDVIDIADKSTEFYRKIEEANNNLADNGGFIEHCSANSKDRSSCEEFDSEYSSSEEEISSSSEEEEPSSSSEEEEPSSSSEEEEVPSSSSEVLVSSSSLTWGIYEIPPFICYWDPNPVEPRGYVQVKIKFEPANAAAEADCEKKAWLGVAELNTVGNPKGVDAYDTLPFNLDENIRPSGQLFETAIDWPSSGEFKSDKPMDGINKEDWKTWPKQIVGSTVICENISEGKTRKSKDQDCVPLQIGFPPSSSSIPPQSSSSEPPPPLSSSSATVSSSSARSSSSVTTVSSSSARSSSSVTTVSSSSVAGSSSSAGGGVDCGPGASGIIEATTAVTGEGEAARGEEYTVKVGSCLRIANACGSLSYPSGKLQLGHWSGGTIEVSFSGACTGSFSFPSENFKATNCTNPTTDLYIKVTSGSTTSFQARCW